MGETQQEWLYNPKRIICPVTIYCTNHPTPEANHITSLMPNKGYLVYLIHMGIGLVVVTALADFSGLQTGSHLAPWVGIRREGLLLVAGH